MPLFNRRPSTPEQVEAIQIHNPAATALNIPDGSWLVAHPDTTTDVETDATFQANYIAV